MSAPQRPRAPGIVIAPLGRLFAVLRVSIADARITELDVIAGPARLDQIVLACIPCAGL